MEVQGRNWYGGGGSRAWARGVDLFGTRDWCVVGDQYGEGRGSGLVRGRGLLRVRGLARWGGGYSTAEIHWWGCYCLGNELLKYSCKKYTL